MLSVEQLDGKKIAGIIGERFVSDIVRCKEKLNRLKKKTFLSLFMIDDV